MKVISFFILSGALSATMLQILAFAPDQVVAQTTPPIIPDRTLGNENSVVKPVNPQVDEIDGGAIRGTNLFHSFLEFNIGEGRTAYFRNPTGIENIISRVTGENPSRLLGTLGVSGNANLFLINPKGIIFGANAQLDIRGSFVGSTASSLTFGKSTQFSATNPQAPPLLAIKVPLGLQFEGIPGAISLKDARLVMLPGKNLALVGGNVTLDGGTLLAPGGRVELGGLAGAGMVELNQNGSLSFPTDVVRANVSLTNASQINVRANGGGSITINAHNLSIDKGSTLRAGIASSQGTVNSQAGDIDITATDAVTLIGTGGSFISNAVLYNAKGKGGNVSITASSLAVTEGFQIFAGTYGQGDVGNVNLNVADTILFDGVGTNGINTGAYNSVTEGGIGHGGNLNIIANSLNVTKGAILQASTVGRGDAGNVNIFVRDTALFDGEAADFHQVSTSIFSSGVYSRVDRFAVGNAGNVNVTARTVKLTHGAVLTTSTAGKGNAGNVIINANDILFNGEGRFNDSPGFKFFQSSGAFSSVKNKGEGNGGNVIVNANSFSLTKGAVVVTSTRGTGDAGDILVNGANTVTIAGFAGDGYSSGLYSNTEPLGIGKGGEITVNTANLRVQDGGVINALTANAGSGGSIIINAQTLAATNGGQIVTATRSSGNAGNITLNVSDSINLAGSDASYSDRVLGITQIGLDTITNQGAASGVLASSDANSTGNGGNIFLHTNKLIIQNQAPITVSSQGSGVAGNIEISAKSILLDNQGAITAETTSTNGGNITLQIQDLLLLRHNSLISTTAGTGQAPGNGGNIKINAENGFIVAVPQENSDIIANAFEGKGGFIDITSFGLFGLERRELLTPVSDITAFSQQNSQLDGVIEINTSGIDPNRGLANLPEEPRSVEIAEGCQASGEQTARVQFFETGRGGSPPKPDEPLSVDIFIADWIDNGVEIENSSQTANSPHLLNLDEKNQVVINSSKSKAINIFPTSNFRRSACQTN